MSTLLITIAPVNPPPKYVSPALELTGSDQLQSLARHKVFAGVALNASDRDIEMAAFWPKVVDKVNIYKWVEFKRHYT